MLESSLIAWSYYLLGAVGLFAFWWKITSGISMTRLQRPLRAAVAVLLLCPFSIGEGYGDMAPAFLMLAMESVFEGGEAFMRVGPTLIGLTLLAVVLSLVWDEYLRRRLEKQASEEELNRHHDELLAESE